MTYTRNPAPDDLTEDRLIGRTQGDALQLISLVRDHGPDVLHRLFDDWGPEHLRRVTIALAAAADDLRTPQELWGWLDGRPVVLSTTVQNSQLWTQPDPYALKEPRRAVAYSPAARSRMAERARNLQRKSA